MNVIEAKIYLLQAPGSNIALDAVDHKCRCNGLGEFEYFNNMEQKWCRFVDMHRFEPFTKVEPERGNVEIVEAIIKQKCSLREDYIQLLDAVDDKIRRAKV